MRLRALAVAILLVPALSVASVAGSVSAQVLRAPGGPLAGLCVYSENQLLGQSQAGVAANRQLAQIQRDVNADIKAKGDQLGADERALALQKASLKPAQYQPKAVDLQNRARDLDGLTKVRDIQLSRTRDDVIARISRAALPLFNASLTTHRCAVVFDLAPIYTVNPAMDLTSEVILKLNAIMPTIGVQLAPPAP